MRNAAPAHDRRTARVVVGIVVQRDVGVHPRRVVAVILRLQCQRIVLGVPRDEELPPPQIRNDVDARIALGENGQLGHGIDVGTARLRMARVRHIENIVKAAQEALMLHTAMVLIDAEDLLLRPVLRDAVVIVEPRLRAPADMERREGVLLAPLHDLRDLVPVGDLLKGILLDRRPRDDETIVLFMAHLGKRPVELREIGA